MKRLAVVLVGALAWILLPVTSAVAHPLGNFSVNHYSGVVVAEDHIAVDHVVDLAEIPTLQLRPAVRNDDEATRYATGACADAAAGIAMAVDGRRVPLTVAATSGAIRPGQGGLATVRLECDFRAQVAVPDGARVTVTDTTDAGRRGWREMTAVGDRMTVTDSDVPVDSRSGRLATYPDDLLSSPPAVISASFLVRSGGPALAAGAVGVGDEAAPRGVDRFTRAFTDLIGTGALGLGTALLAVLIAVAIGAGHALTPGHGKTVMAAYLVGRNGTRRQAVALGATVTVTHTAVVLILGALLSSAAIGAPERLVPGLEAFSGLLLVAVAVVLARRALRTRRMARAQHPHDHPHPHPHPHPKDHPQPRDHPLVPVPAAGGPAVLVAERPVHTHTHGGATHSHAPLPETFSWTGLVAIGVAGGLIPSPSALVVLLSQSSLGRPLFGTVLVVGYGIGMAATLSFVGLLVVRGRTALGRRFAAPPRLMALLPVVTAVGIGVVGVALALRALPALS